MLVPSGKKHVPNREKKHRSRAGNVAILTALMLVMLFAFAALAVDVGDMYRVRGQTQSAVDAAALAGAMSLNGTTNGLAAARTHTTTFGGYHQVYTSKLQLSEQEIELGNWDRITGEFTTSGVSTDDTNAVRVRHSTDEMKHPFAAVLGQGKSAVAASAVAVGGGPMSIPCAFPLVVPECALIPAIAGDKCGYCMKMQDNNSDTAGWTSWGAGRSVNGNGIFEAIASACTTGSDYAPAVGSDGMCKSTCDNQPNLSTKIPVNNGNFMNTGGPKNFCELIQKILQRNGTAEAFTVSVPVMKTGKATPCNPQFSGEVDVAGFAQLTIFGARCGNASNAPEVKVADRVTGDCNPPSGKYLLADLHCNGRVNAPGGGGFFGLQARPRLVK